MDERQLIYALERRVTRLEQQLEHLTAAYEGMSARFNQTNRSNLPQSAIQLIKDGRNPLKVIRQSRLLTQQQLADVSGVGVNYISRIENGGGFGLQTARRLAEALGVKVEDLSQR